MPAEIIYWVYLYSTIVKQLMDFIKNLFSLVSLLQTISAGFLSHSPVLRQVTVNIPSGNSPSEHWNVTRVSGRAGTEWSMMMPFCGGDSGGVQFIGGAEIITISQHVLVLHSSTHY